MIDGVFSIKSDVYSFDVVVLEVVSGERIRNFCHPDDDLMQGLRSIIMLVNNIINSCQNNVKFLLQAWKLYVEGDCLELINRATADSRSPFEVFRAIQIGLLCVQPYARD